MSSGPLQLGVLTAVATVVAAAGSNETGKRSPSVVQWTANGFPGGSSSFSRRPCRKYRQTQTKEARQHRRLTYGHEHLHGSSATPGE